MPSVQSSCERIRRFNRAIANPTGKPVDASSEFGNVCYEFQSRHRESDR